MFLQNAKEISEKKKLLCRKYGFEGVFPLEKEVELKTRAQREIGLCVSALKEALIKSCEVVVANLKLFRGPSCDVGTAYEIGLAHALDKKVFAYNNVLTPS